MTLVSGKRIHNRNRVPPYAKRGWPMLGVLPELSRDPPKFLNRLMEEHGSVVPIRIGPHRVIVAGHPDAVQRVTVLNAGNYQKTRFVEKLIPILGNGLATSNGHIWEQSRRVIQPALTHDRVARTLDVIDSVIIKAVDEWPSEEFNIGHASGALTLRVLSATMFGSADADAARRVVSAIDDIQDYISKSIWSVVEWRRLIGAPSYRKFGRAMTGIWALVHEMIRSRRSGEKRDDLLQALIDAVDTTTGEPFSGQQILDEVMTVFMAGHDTTGNTLAFVWHALASDPDLQTRIRNEVMAHIPLDRAPSFADLQNLRLTTSLVKEVMRLYPSSWWFARTADADDEIMGVPVHAGDVVMVAPYVTHRLPEFWQDAQRFDPSRFLDQKLSHKFSYLPFGAGPRMCPGSHFATAEMLIAIARVLQRRELHTKGELACEALVTLRPKDGLPMVAKPWESVVTVSGVRPGQHQMVDAMLRLRKLVFADQLGWRLHIDDSGREVDGFDDEDAEYSALVAVGRIVAYGRLRRADKPSLLFDVYPQLIDDSALLVRGVDIWEGTRLGTSPDLAPDQRAERLGKLVADAQLRKRREGATYFCSVSDLKMEKVLNRLGVVTRRLGTVHIDEHGVPALGLRIELGDDIR